MKLRPFFIAVALALSWLGSALAQAPPTVYQAPWTQAGSFTLAVSAASSNVSVSVTSPSPSYGPLTAIVCNTGAVDAYVALGGSAVVATTSNFDVRPGACPALALNGATYVAGITASSTTTLSIAIGTGSASNGAGPSGGVAAAGMATNAANAVLPDALNNLGAMSTTASNASAAIARQNLHAYPVLNARDPAYGMVCDGVTDDAAALQAAATAAATLGSNVFISGNPSGALATCELSTRVSWPSGVSLSAVPGTVVLQMASGNSSSPGLLLVQAANNITVSGVTFDGALGAGQTNINPIIQVNGTASHVVFDTITVQHTRGIGIAFVGAVSYSGVRNSTLNDIGNYWTISGINADQKQGITFSNGSATTTLYDFVTGNDITSTGLDAISADLTGSLLIANNRIVNAGGKYSNGGAAIYLPRANATTIANNIVSGTYGAGIDTADSTNYTITGNSVTNAGSGGIGVAAFTLNSGNITIVGNTVTDSNQGGLSSTVGGFYASSFTGKTLSNVTYSGNTTSDDQGSPTQTYGFQILNAGGTLNKIAFGPSNTIGTVATSAFGGLATTYIFANQPIDGITIGGAAMQLGVYSAVPSAPGGAAVHSYAPIDSITLAAGTSTISAIVIVESTQMVSVNSIANAGSGGTPGACTLTGTTGVGTKFQVAATVGAGGTLSSTGAISVAGAYTTNPTSLTAEPVTSNCSLTGAQLSINMGVLTTAVRNPGNYTIPPQNPITQASSSGAGTGATFTVAWRFLPELIDDAVSRNLALPGLSSFGSLTGGYSNVAYGRSSLASLTSGHENTALGVFSGQRIANGSDNTVVGLFAGQQITSGGSNTVVGASVGNTNLATGSNNLLLGTNSSCDTAAAGTANNIILCAGGAAVFSATGAGTPSTSVSTIAGTLNVAGPQLTGAGTIRTTSQNTTGFTGSGGELAWTGAATELRSYDRTGVAAQPLTLTASTLTIGLTGNATLTGGGTLTGLGTPTNASDAATKSYADAIASGIVTHAAAQAATTANLTATPAGTGVGHTLTNSGALAAFAVDGYSASVNDRILVKNQTTQKDNGIYTVTTVGSGAVAWVLTRATDFDQASASEVAAGAAVIIINGTANARTQWVETGQGPFTVDTTAIIFSQVTSNASGQVNSGTVNQLGYYAGTGTAISGLATAANGTLVTDGSSVPSISSTLPAAVQGNITSVGTLTSGIWNGTIVDITHGGTGVSLAATGAAHNVLQQASVGATITVGRLACADLSDAATGCSATQGSAATANTGTSGHVLGFLDGANTYSALQSFNSGDFALNGSATGSLKLNTAANGGASTITLPNGTTDFSATGGTNFVVQQASTGAAFTVGQLAASNLSNGTTGTGGGVVLATAGVLTKPTLTDAINQEAHVQTGAFSVSSTTLTTFTGLDQTFTAAGLYSCSGHIHFTTAPTTSNGFKVALVGDGTVSVNSLSFYAEAHNTTTIPVTGTATALGSTAFTSLLAMSDVDLSAAININVGGVIHVQGAENTASGTIAATAGSARWDCHRAA